MAIRKKHVKRRRYWPFAIALCSLIIFVATAYVAYLVTQPLNIPEDETYVLKQGDSATDLAKLLQDNGHLQHSDLLIWVAKFGQYEHSLKAGEYQFQPEFNLFQLLEQIVEGKSVTHQIKFIEGWTFDDYLEQLRSKPNLEQTLLDLDNEAILEKLGIAESHPEGLFFPDTYNYNSGQTDFSLLQRANQALTEILDREWANRNPDLPYETPYECLIVASIIEKETSVPEEYPIIAGVIVNRLNQGMRLQMDPTVIYGLGGINGPIRRSHLDKDTPYNTYTRFGLPPTPIAMPGLAAIQAAARPAETTSLYFVAVGDGTHKFSDTIAEHIEAVRAYRKFEKSQS